MSQHPYREAAPAAFDRYCLHCGAQRPSLGVPCPACAAAPVAEATPPSATDALACPRCATALAASTIDGALVFSCAACLGCFVPERAWSAIMARIAADEPAPMPGFVPLPPGREIPASTLCAMVRCPLCARPADRITFGARSGIVVDVCPSHGTWFDAAEIVRVKQFVLTRDAAAGPGRAELERERRIEEDRLAARSAIARAELDARERRGRGVRESHLIDVLAALLRW